MSVLPNTGSFHCRHFLLRYNAETKKFGFGDEGAPQSAAYDCIEDFLEVWANKFVGGETDLELFYIDKVSGDDRMIM